MKDLNPSEDMTVDKYALHRECARQPELYRQYSEAAVTAQEELDDLDNREKVLRSELILKARDKKKRGDKASTNAMGDEAYYRTHPKHTRLMKKIGKARFNANILKGNLVALNHKKRMLENLTSQWVNNYFSEPRGKDEGEREFQRDVQEMKDADTRKRISKRTKRRSKK